MLSCAWTEHKHTEASAYNRLITYELIIFSSKFLVKLSLFGKRSEAQPGKNFLNKNSSPNFSLHQRAIKFRA